MSDIETRGVAGRAAEALAQGGDQEWRTQGRSQEKVVHIQKRAAVPGKGQSSPQGETKGRPQTVVDREVREQLTLGRLAIEPGSLTTGG